MRMIFKSGLVEIWEVAERTGCLFYVYGLRSDPIVCPSEGMAFEMVAGA